MKNLTQNDIYNILNKRTKDNIYKTLKDMPQPDSLKDIKKATKRIIEAIKNDETINVVGDYDVDGVVSTTIMVQFFNILGVEVNYIIPNRFKHGYGINAKILDDIYDGIIITVDNGISAYRAGEICDIRNLDLIITDHHTVADILPKAYAIVNPKQSDCQFPFKDICGAQVAWYLCAMIKKELKVDINMIIFFDLLALAIVADVMPMQSLNATMVKRGLKELEKSKRPAFVILRERFSLKNINEEDIGFKIAPLINCAGRMENASLALEFLLSFDIFEAEKSLNVLVELNELRKQTQLTIFDEAKSQVDIDDEVIVVSSTTWNEGIIGIVASKLSETYKKPAFVFSIKNGKVKGSSRSSSINLYDLVALSSEKLLGFGGHKGAAGMSLNEINLKSFKQLLNINIKKLFVDNSIYNIDALGILNLSHIDMNLYNIIDSFRPFGLENEIPKFLFKDVEVLDIKKMGKNKEFTKLIVSNNITTLDVVVFIEFKNEVKILDRISFIATLSKNEFRGDTSFNLIFKELL
jgi:single-stranded-DNA-specific exonuclease